MELILEQNLLNEGLFSLFGKKGNSTPPRSLIYSGNKTAEQVEKDVQIILTKLIKFFMTDPTTKPFVVKNLTRDNIKKFIKSAKFKDCQYPDYKKLEIGHIELINFNTNPKLLGKMMSKYNNLFEGDYTGNETSFDDFNHWDVFTFCNHVFADKIIAQGFNQSDVEASIFTHKDYIEGKDFLSVSCYEYNESWYIFSGNNMYIKK